MKDCFEYGTPETLPFLIAHAFITVVSNVSIVFRLFNVKHKKWKDWILGDLCRTREGEKHSNIC